MTDPSVPVSASAQERAAAARVLRDEAQAIAHLADRLDERFNAAVDLLVQAPEHGGTVLVTGLGKSGLVGAKIAATLASLGIPSHAVHPSEAAHGDLGRFRPNDVVLAISNSGETEEVVNLAAILKQDGLAIVAIVGRDEHPPTTLERLATVTLPLGVDTEAGELTAPTTSTTATLALGDALAVAAASRMGVTTAEFARRHPGGTLGGLLRPVTDVLRFRAGDNLPLVRDTVTVAEALAQAAETDRRPGAILLVNERGMLSGIFTDGDLRRLVLRDRNELARPIAEIMTRTPRTIHADARVADAVRLVREQRQDEVPVVDAEGRPVGVLDVQDLITLKLVRDLTT